MSGILILRLYFILFFCFFCGQAFALDQNEILSVKILRKIKVNYLSLNRGLEDGIQRGDHGKIVSDNGFIARAIAIKVTGLTSHWKIYRVVNPQLVDTDANFFLKSIRESEIPDEYKQYAGRGFVPDETILSEMKNADLKKEIQDRPDEMIISDMETELNSAPIPEKGSKNLSSDKKSDTTQTDPKNVNQLFAQNFNATQFSKDFEQLDARVFASPIRFGRINSTRDITYGAALGNPRGGKYELATDYSYNKFSQFDPFNKSRVSNSTYVGNMTFDINNFYKKFTYFALASYYRQRIGTIYPVRQQVRAGPIGVKYKFLKTTTVPDLSLSYIPIWESMSRDEQIYDPITYQSRTQTKTINLVRHSFRFRLKLNFGLINLSEQFYWRPAHYVDQRKFDGNDADINNQFIFSYFLNQYVAVSYENLYTSDIRLKRNYQIPSSNMIHTVNFNVNFSL